MFGILSLILALVPHIVQAIQTIHGDRVDGATKAKMAQDALQAATNAAGAVLTGNNAAYSQIAGQVAQVAIDQTVNIAKATGAYQKWTAAAGALETGVATTAAAVEAAKAVNTSNVAAAPVAMVKP